MQAGSKWEQEIFLAAVCYQAMERYWDKRRFVLPKGYRLVASLGNSGFPRLGIILASRRNIIVAFCGTQNLPGLAADLDVGRVRFPFLSNSGKTARGITELYAEVIRPKVFGTLKRLPQKKVVITGHSMGAALATLCALDVAANTRFSRPTVCTFGSPRVGSPRFARVFNNRVGRSIRIVNAYDVVPRLPPGLFGLGYRHVQRKQVVCFQNGNPVANHEIRRYFDALCRENPSYCRKLCRTQVGFCPKPDGGAKK
ncbi:lipase family protein [Brevibacillus sp. SYP-B805]|uniref:lipase family protein n=1 Tax=Brevibacillus sp. SYP-B805 TaxID=1578199 RepID=UPI0013EC205B|nr:lipase family protein [Brevibacillus sp. SYP-B805]NGQ95161.1 lipase family protein [Brevibacillus sp. SYP-B805]